MNSELLSFSVLAAVLGMGVVFLFLGILSVLMAAINRVFGEREQESQSARNSGHENSERRSESQETEAVPEWVIAATVAFVLEEEQQVRRSASAWRPIAGAASDGWVILPRL